MAYLRGRRPLRRKDPRLISVAQQNNMAKTVPYVRTACESTVARPWPVDLREASLADADLQEANFERTTLSRTDLRRACLRGARLSGAVLAVPDTVGADLRGAEMTGMTAYGVAGPGLYGALTDDCKHIPKHWGLRQKCRRDP